MAGDWMKIELELPDKPEVHSIAAMLNIDPDAVVGKLIRIWQWFDKHTTDGNAFGVTYSLPDRISGVTGFAEAMVFVGWLEQNDKVLTMPKFDRHTSNSAKTRARTQKRVLKTRNAATVTEALPEKRREEKSKTTTPSEYSDDFEKFWSIYPKKTAKGGAWKSWKVQKPDINATFDVVQLQSGKSAQVKITALNTAAESGVNFIDGYANDSTVTITNVIVRNAAGTIIENSNGTVNDQYCHHVQ